MVCKLFIIAHKLGNPPRSENFIGFLPYVFAHFLCEFSRIFIAKFSQFFSASFCWFSLRVLADFLCEFSRIFLEINHDKTSDSEDDIQEGDESRGFVNSRRPRHEDKDAKKQRKQASIILTKKVK